MRATNAALLDAAQAAVMPALFALTLLQQLSIPMLTPMHTLPRWLAGAGVVVWLGLALALARVGSARMRWVLALGGSAGAAVVAAVLAAGRGGGMAEAAGWSLVAGVLAGLGALVATWRTKPTRVAPRRTAARARSATGSQDGSLHLATRRGRTSALAGVLISVVARRVAPWQSSAASATGWAIAIGFGVCAALFIDGFTRSLSAPGAARGAGMLLMLIAFFLLLPAATLAGWYPRIARIGWVTGAACALTVVLRVDTPSLAGLLVTLAVAGYAVGAPIQAGEALATESGD